MQTSLDMGTRLGPQLEKIDGFISIERFQSFLDPRKLLALWRDEAAVVVPSDEQIFRCLHRSTERMVRVFVVGGCEGALADDPVDEIMKLLGLPYPPADCVVPNCLAAKLGNKS